jgi:two-component system cell cycle sensor histidine kinase/response regulator CckA
VGFFIVPYQATRETIATSVSDALFMKPPRTIEPLSKDARGQSTLVLPPLALQKNKKVDMHYRALLEAAPDAIVVFNQSGAIVLVNAQAESLFGYRPGELIGRPAEILVSEHFRGQHSKQHSAFLAVPSVRPTVAGLELFGLRKDGSEFPAELRLSPLNTKQGILVSSAIRDISERRRTEEDLRRLASIVESSDDAIIGKTLEGIITSWNAGAERMYGYSAREVMGKPVSMLVPADRPVEIAMILERLKRGETVDHFETIRVRKDGTQFHIEVTVSPIRDAVERTIAASAIGRDISVRKEAEKHLVQMEAKYRGLLEAAPDAMVIVNQAEEIVLLNLQAEKQFRYRRDELLGQKVTNIIPEGFAERLLTHGTGIGDDSIVPQMGTGIELYGRRKDGSDFPIEIMLSPLDGVDGILVTAAIRDITERKRHEDELSRLAAVVESSYDAIVGLTTQGIILTWNHGAERIFGYRAEEAMGRSISFLYPSDQPADGPSLLERVERPDAVERFETVRVKKDGTRIHVDLTLSPIKNAGGQVVGVSSVARDVTENRQLEDMYRQAQKMEAVGQLAGGIAHDFNNLLGVILGYTGLLLDRLDDPNDPQRKDIEQIQKAGNRAALLTSQLLAFSRKQVLQSKVLDLNAVVAGMEKLLQRLIGEHIELLVILNPALGRIKADSGQLEQIIMNLAVNARDAMPAGGKLTIETSNVELDEQYTAQHADTQTGPHVMLAVTDTGCGMDAKTKAHIFEPFFTTKEFGKGTGLGLATVYGIVKQSGGSVWVYTEPGIGTTFKTYFPCVGPVLEITSTGEKAEKVDRGSQTILIVEDDAALLEVTHRSLEAVGYAILAARSAMEAIRIAETHLGPIHLMVTDVIMPGMSGVQLAFRLSALRPEMKVLYVSGYTDDTIVHHGVLQPGLEFLQKPFSPKMLARKVGEVLSIWSVPTS